MLQIPNIYFLQSLPNLGKTLTSRTGASPLLNFGQTTFICSFPSAFFLISRYGLLLKCIAEVICLNSANIQKNIRQ